VARGPFTHADLYEALLRLPMDLSDQYRFILGRIPDERRSEAMNILAWLAFTFRPLSCQEFVEAMEPQGLDSSIELNPTTACRRANQIVDLVFDLVEIRQDRVLLVHSTVREFLLSEQHSITSHPYHANEQILSTCFETLLEEPDVKKPAFFSYAAEFWMRHFEEIDHLPPSIVQALDKLFDVDHPECFLRWLRHYDPLNPEAGPQPEKRLEDFPSREVYMNNMWDAKRHRGIGGD